MVDGEARAVVEHHRLATADLGRDVDGGGVVADDLEVRGGVGHQGVVEPGQVLAHETAGKVVGGPDRLALGADPALVPHPAEAPHDRPFVEADGVGRVLFAVRGRVEGQLPAGVVEDQVVGLAGRVDAAAQLAGLDQVHPDGGARVRGPGPRSARARTTPRSRARRWRTRSSARGRANEGSSASKGRAHHEEWTPQFHAHAGPFLGIAAPPRYAAVVGQDKHLRPFGQAGG